jgi:large subunit ribosomal protein L7/L12
LNSHKNIKTFKILSLIKLHIVINFFETTFDVNASISSIPSTVTSSINSNKVEEEAIEEKTEFDVILEVVPADKVISAIKSTRKVTGLGLKESKEFVVSAPVTILQGVSKDKAEEVKKIFDEVNVNVVIK